MKKYFALVKTSRDPLKSIHYDGLPNELTEDNKRTSLLPPNVLVIEEKNDGIYLYRYTSKGEFCGDTWHQTIEDAKDQAEYEYGKSIKEWKEIPEEVKDSIDFAIKQAQQ